MLYVNILYNSVWISKRQSERLWIVLKEGSNLSLYFVCPYSKCPNEDKALTTVSWVSYMSLCLYIKVTNLTGVFLSIPLPKSLSLLSGLTDHPESRAEPL